MKISSISAVGVALLATLFMQRVAAQSPYIYVGNAGEDTASKINVTNNTEEARYATWFTPPDPHQIAHLNSPWQGPAPSRIAQDSTGNFYVLDRFFPLPAVTAGNTPIGPHLPVLLKIAPSGGTPGTNTSLGSTVLPMLDNSPPDNHINITPGGEAKDVRILWAAEIGTAGKDEGQLGRALCIDPKGFLWVGIFSTQKYYKVDPNTGATLSSVLTTGHTPYGCQVDMNGKLWSVDLGNSLGEIDTNSGAFVKHDHTSYGSNYALSLYNDCKSSPPKVTVYISSRSGHSFIAYDPLASAFSTPAAVQFASMSVGVDSQGNIFSGATGGSGRVLKSSPTGAKIWDTTDAGHGPTQSVTDFRGLIVDSFDDIWVVDKASSGRVLKYSGANGTFIQPVAVGNMPYTYGNPPPPTCSGTDGGDTGGGCAPIKGEVRCLPDGSYSYTFNVTNKSGNPVSQILLTPAPGSTFTLTPQLGTFSPTLQNGQSKTVKITIGNVKPGDKICFFVSLLSEKAQCCNVEFCLTLPDCGQVGPTPTVTSSLPPTLRQQPAPARQAPRGRRRP